jgi:hypothetical protein
VLSVSTVRDLPPVAAAALVVFAMLARAGPADTARVGAVIMQNIQKSRAGRTDGCGNSRERNCRRREIGCMWRVWSAMRGALVCDRASDTPPE